jgi:hypothetical protein
LPSPAATARRWDYGTFDEFLPPKRAFALIARAKIKKGF